MSEVITLEWIGAEIRKIQAEQRNIHAENKLIREGMSEMINVLLARIGNFEALIEIRLDRIDAQLAKIGAEE